MVELNAFPASQIQNLAPRGCPSQGSTWATFVKKEGSNGGGYFQGPLGYVKHLWFGPLGFMVLAIPLVVFRQILEREFQKCEAQPAFLPGFIWEPQLMTARPPETAERRRRDRRPGRTRAIGAIQQTH